MTGIIAALIGSSGFAALPRVYNTVGTFTDVIPNGAKKVQLGDWGAPGGGGAGNGASAGGGAASGAYCQSLYPISPSDWGKTLIVTVHAPGAGGVSGGNGTLGGDTTIASGTFSITTMSATGGTNGVGANTGGSGGPGASATGGNQLNVNGNSGLAGISGGTGGLGITGLLGEIGAAGGNGGAINQPGAAGAGPGLAVIQYT